MNPRHYFPLGKAHGEAFCNRIKETKRLVGNFENGKHILLSAPRRYGKSSLCEKALECTNISNETLDFYLATSEKDVERIIINGVVELIGKAAGPISKLTALLKEYTNKLKPKLSIGTKHFNLELEVGVNSFPAENIKEALMLLEKLLQKKQKQAIILFDEFQEIGQMGKGIEGAIRHVGQDTKNLSFVFSGSNPHLLRAMFDDERRPLYKLCRKLMLGRISEKHYLSHLNKAAKQMWGQALEDEVFKFIMNATERHPYYVNYLCDALWAENEELPSLENVKYAWLEVVEEERSDLLKDFFRLTENQRKILIHIAQEGGENLYSNKAVKKMDIPLSSVSRGINSLVEGDYVEKTALGYRLIVPAYKTLLKVNF